KTHEVHSQRTNDASQEDLERLRADCTILHFATHGFLNGEKPSRTFLELATPPGDGQLAQSEIWPRLKKLVPAFHDHHIRLVVLSACETARAEDDPQAEVLGLPDSFALAGASAVVASLWSVYTYATTDLMVDFYRRLRVDGMDAASALQSAKIALLRGKEGRYAHPFFWAAFLLFGDWRSK
ncbi:MAG: CHAT domain-containing protein, partial [Planctomycetes bacterium]|nr:CHAT domain-containing protein [Planctomycetota bacterium]